MWKSRNRCSDGVLRVIAISIGAFLLVDGGSQLNGQTPKPVIARVPNHSAAIGTPYLFYLHGRIVEDQGPEAVSSEFGPYRYMEIVGVFADSGFTVVSEVRAPNTDPLSYADSIVQQIERLVALGVPPDAITVVGASKGAVIAMLVATQLVAIPIRFVLLASCNDTMRRRFSPRLHGDVLSIYEASDAIGQSCREIFAESPQLRDRRELRLQTGLGHGFIFHPLPEWVGPTVRWARGRSP